VSQEPWLKREKYIYYKSQATVRLLSFSLCSMTIKSLQSLCHVKSDVP